jgi:hypothetical protein
MADIDEVLDSLAFHVSEIIKPYQPDARPMYPNPLPTAGQIPATLIASGYPIQNHVMKRLENHLAQVATFDLKPGSVFPFYNRFAVTNDVRGTAEVGTESFDETREKKQVAIQVWCSTKVERQALSKLIRTGIGDAYRIHHLDGSLTLFKYIKLETEDYEQVDSVYVRTYLYEADLTIIGPQSAGKILYPVSTLEVNTDATLPPLRVNTL